MVVDGQQGESRSAAIIRRLRMEFARIDVSESEAARQAGMTQDKMSRRMTGKTPFDVNDIDRIASALSLSFDFIMTGIRALPGGPNGGIDQPSGVSDHTALAAA